MSQSTEESSAPKGCARDGLMSENSNELNRRGFVDLAMKPVWIRLLSGARQ